MYKIYLLDICDFEDAELREQALGLIDDQRRMLVDQCLREKNRMRAIAAGLLLQAGFLELEPEPEWCEQIFLPQSSTAGMCYKMQVRKLVHYFQEYLNACERNNAQPFCVQLKQFPVQLTYGKGIHGKPFWDRQAMEETFSFKKLWHFNLSHSGKYVALAVADCEVGVDIQEFREVKRFEGGYQEFSRMEAYVKCTGEGYAHGYKRYQKYQGNVPGYEILNLDIIEQYAFFICIC